MSVAGHYMTSCSIFIHIIILSNIDWALMLKFRELCDGPLLDQLRLSMQLPVGLMTGHQLYSDANRLVNGLAPVVNWASGSNELSDVSCFGGI